MDCPRCGKHLSTKGILVTHLKMKKPCNTTIGDIDRESIIKKLQEKKLGEKKYGCIRCNKLFNSRQARYSHQNSCNFVPEITPTNLLSVSVPVINSSNTKNSTNITNNYNQCNITNVIVINGIGNETAPFITEESIKRLFLDKSNGIHELFKLKHINNDIPENQNLRKKVHRDNFIELFNGKNWESKDYNTVCKDIFRNLGKDLVEFLNNNKDINFNDLSEDNQERLVFSFMDKIGIPLEWYMLLETETMRKFKDNYNVDFTDFDKKRKEIFSQVKETIYQFTKNK